MRCRSVFLVLLGLVLLGAPLAAQQAKPLDVEKLKAFDFGPVDSPVFPGFTAVSERTAFDDRTGFGWLDVRNLASADRTTPGALERDWVRGPGTFAVRIPNGKYHVWMLSADSGDSGSRDRWSEKRVKAQGRVVFERRMTHDDFLKQFFANLDVEDLPGQDVFMLYVESRWWPIEFDVEVTTGRLEISLEGDPGATLVNALVLYPLSQKDEGEAWLKNLADRRRQEFYARFVEVPPPEARVEVFPNEAEKKRGYVVFQRRWSEPVWPTSSPRGGGREIDALEVTLARGESEPVTFSIYPFQDLGKVKVSASLPRVSHAGPGRTMSQPEVGYVQYKVKRTEPHGTSYQSTPALIRHRNELRIDRGITRRFWVTLQSDQDTFATRYDGVITITPEHGEPTTLPLTVTVLDFVLPEPKGVTFWLSGWRPADFWAWLGGPEDETRRALNASVRNIRAHGLSDATLPGIPDGPHPGRFAWGVRAYKEVKEAKTGARFGSCGPWMAFHGDPFFDLDAADPDYCLVFPSPEGDLNTPTFEMLREGIDDFRYLWTVDRLTQAAFSRSAAHWHELWTEGDGFLKSVCDQVDPDARPDKPWSYERCQEVRRKAAELIAKFLAAGATLPQ